MDTENETISQYNREVNQIHFYIWVLSTSAVYISVFLCYYSIKLTKKVSSINQVRFYIDIYKRHSDPNKKEKPTIESNDASVKNVGNSFTFDGIELHGGVLLNFFLLNKASNRVYWYLHF